MVDPIDCTSGDFEQILDFIREELPDRFTEEDRVEENNHVFKNTDGSESIGVLFLVFDDIETTDNDNYVELDFYIHSDLDRSEIVKTEEELVAAIPN